MKQMSTMSKQTAKRSGEVQSSQKHCRPRQKAPKQLLNKEKKNKKISEERKGISKIQRNCMTKSGKGEYPPRDIYSPKIRSNHPDTLRHQGQEVKFEYHNKEEEKQAADVQIISDFSTQASTVKIPPRSIKPETPTSHQTGKEGVKVELLISVVLMAFMALLMDRFKKMLKNEGITYKYMKYKWETYESLRQRQTKHYNWLSLVQKFARTSLNIQTNLLQDKLLAILLFKNHGAKIANEPRAIAMRKFLEKQEEEDRSKRRRQAKSGLKEQAIRAKQERRTVQETITGPNLNFMNLGYCNEKRYENLRVFYEVFAPRKNQSNFKLFLQHEFIQEIWIKLFDPAHRTPEDFFNLCHTKKHVNNKKPIPDSVYAKGFKKFAQWMGPARLFPDGFIEFIDKKFE
ncbi:hypothetical protein FGO68_gene16672 [Halteria grandinella]|uniref:Uncharacterized protein n=1 Tax=Halteria grandinella TaxID=5974 RepID=A0A8J8N9Z3_HALGN|nr:hypothetical protein FGO68_gene16672 [Halteria grandinella]